jgi:MutS domain V/MutS domain III
MKNIFLPFILTASCAYAHTPVITEYEQRDLQLFQTYQQKPGLISKIDRTITAMGHDYLKERLANPLVEVQALINRQQIIKALIDDHHIRLEIEEILKEFAQNEQSLAALANTDPICENIIGNFYFKNSYLQWLNTYPAGLEAGQFLHIANLSVPLLEHAVIHFLISQKLQDYFGIHCHHSHDRGHEGRCCHHTELQPSTLFAYNTYNIAHSAIHLIGFKGLVDHIMEQSQVMQAMQKDLIAVAHCIKNARKLYDLMQMHPQLYQTLDEFYTLHSLFCSNPHISAELQEFLTLISSKTFAGSSSFFSRPGIILRAYALAKKVRAELQEKLLAIAELDFYLGNARLFTEYESTQTPFTFAHYTADATPSITVQGFWNLLTPETQAIGQAVQLGNLNPHIAIVTGPNKAGKSTSLHALCSAVVLAQTLSIVPASYCQLTPFLYIRTAFNMNMRVNHDQSLLSASLDFAHGILEYAQANKNSLMLIAIDELFTSTDVHTGQEIAHRFGNALSLFDNCIGLIATHFSSLTQLEKEKPSIFKNYKAELIAHDTGSQYILVPGISDSNQVLRLVQEEAEMHDLRLI